jgi:hypothetical protein
MPVNVRQIAIQFSCIYRETDQVYYPDLDFVGVQVESDRGTLSFPIQLTTEMRNKVFQATNAEGEFVHDLCAAIKAFLSGQEG